MSRLVVAVFAAHFVMTPAAAQPSTTEDGVAASIERARKSVAVDEEGCVKYPQNDDIVVCGENPDNKSQRIFRDRGAPDEDRIRTGEAVSSKRAAACLRGDNMCKIHIKGVGMGFGYVPPPAIPLEEVFKGLPEPDMVVQEGALPP
jgi:hypothetical protein